MSLPSNDRCPTCGHHLALERWQPENIARLRKWWGAGLSAGQIARKFDGAYSRSAILGKICRLGLQRSAQG